MTNERMRTHVARVLDRLAETYPDAGCTLRFANAWELLVATVLSAQTTDARVNEITGRLFPRATDARALARIPREQLEEILRPLGLHRTKARTLTAMARTLVERYDGEVPGAREDLEALPGVGRKTASVVLGNVFAEPALAVDTHVERLAGRLELSRGRTPAEVERDLTDAIAPDRWAQASHLLIAHGRARCAARSPDCGGCEIHALCPYPGGRPAGLPLPR